MQVEFEAMWIGQSGESLNDVIKLADSEIPHTRYTRQ